MRVSQPWSDLLEICKTPTSPVTPATPPTSSDPAFPVSLLVIDYLQNLLSLRSHVDVSPGVLMADVERDADVLPDV